VNILLLSAGGGGGNILRSLKTLFERDTAVAGHTDAAYAKRLQEAVTTRFLDTNEFSLADVPPGERLLIGPRTTGHIGARHNPDVARQALEESRSTVEELIQRHAVVILIGTGGKGTGAGTMFPLAEMARRHRKLVLPIFVRPSFERHEVDKRRYDHALQVAAQFDAAGIRLMEILNDRGYTEDNPRSQSAIWEQMNLPIARGLRGLIYVLSDLSQVDPSDLSVLFAGNGRFRIAFAEIDPPAGQDPAHEQVDQAVQRCAVNPFCAFSRPPGTSLVCIQGEWSNVVDARIKSRLAATAMRTRANSPYNPLYARAVAAPRPWGVTAVFAEHTGPHQALEIDWSFAKRVALPIHVTMPVADPYPVLPILATEAGPPPVVLSAEATPQDEPVITARNNPPANFSSLWELAVAVNRSDPAALAVAAGSAVPQIPIEGAEVRKLLGTLWFRSVVPRLSPALKERILDVFVESVTIPNHRVRRGRDVTTVSDLSYTELQEAVRTSVLDVIKPDLDLLLTVGRLFGPDAVRRIRFVEPAVNNDRSALAGLLHGWRHRDDATVPDGRP
jgi:cell division GTPase FtsZ